ncbi:MAG: dienelactone hydrolase family protein [Polyangiaceae bacterium]
MGTLQPWLWVAGVLTLGCGGAPSAVSPAPGDAGDGGECAPQFKPAGESRCTVTASSLDCPPTISTVGGRQVYWQVPLGAPPAEGWPAVVVYQPSYVGPDETWSGSSSAPLGAFNYMLMQALLLDNGFAVIAPTTATGCCWDTNFPDYDTSSDATFIPELLAAITGGQTFGPVNAKRLYATGMSSGGFMTSRMAVSYEGSFAALAIQSGGYATCSASPCDIPALPGDHPPTLFLHGGMDPLVPVSFAQDYHARLLAQNTETQLTIDPNATHEVLAVAPQEVTCWFLSH